VLTPGGRVAVTAWDHPDRARIFGWVLEALDAAGAAPPSDIPAGPPFFRYVADNEITALLHAGGFQRATVETVTFTHHAATIDDIWDGITEGTVRTAALIRRQPDETQQAIHCRINKLVAAGTHDGAIEIPFSVKLAAGGKRDEPPGIRKRTDLPHQRLRRPAAGGATPTRGNAAPAIVRCRRTFEVRAQARLGETRSAPRPIRPAECAGW
jgi:hypothetical protein